MPANFDERDLFGTWTAEYGVSAKDTIVLKADGTYMQSFYSPLSDIRIEVESNRWWLEDRPSGFPLVHLEGMHRCDSTDELCSRQEGGIGPEDWAFDACEKVRLEMPKEVILIATRAPAGEGASARGIQLRHARLAGSDWSYTFRPEG